MVSSHPNSRQASPGVSGVITNNTTRPHLIFPSYTLIILTTRLAFLLLISILSNYNISYYYTRRRYGEPLSTKEGKNL